MDWVTVGQGWSSMQGEACCCYSLWIYESKLYSHLLFSDYFRQLDFFAWTLECLRIFGIEVEDWKCAQLGRCLFDSLVFSLASFAGSPACINNYTATLVAVCYHSKREAFCITMY